MGGNPNLVVYFTKEDLLSFTTIDCNYTISSFEGIKLLPNVTSITCSAGSSLSLDLSHENEITNLVFNNTLSNCTLDLSGCPDDISLTGGFSANVLTYLQTINGWEKITSLTCKNGTGNPLDLTAWTALEFISVASTSVNVSGLKNLIELNCSYTALEELNFEGCENLAILNCSNSKLTTLNVSGLKNLTELNCSSSFSNVFLEEL
ncbi:MAG: hypothetical protein LBD85_05655, partial [Oscillospiraceae bacterium]|nr:hypothetical protein [Oscillospiraceae bacterium]